MKLQVDYSTAAKAVQLVAGVCGYSDDLPVVIDATGGLQYTSATQTLTTADAIIRDLCRRKNRTDLLGAGPAEQAWVNEWLAAFTKLQAPTPASFAVLARLNAHLLTNTFAAGNKLTAADLVLFAGVWGHCSVLKDRKEFDAHCSVLRWFNTLQSLPAVAAAVAARGVNLPALDLKIPASSIFIAKFEPPAPAPGSEEKKEAGAEKKEKKAAKAAQAQAATGVTKPTDAYRLDIRVGLVKECVKHPTEGDRLFVCTVDVGESKPRTVVCGVAEWAKAEQVKGSKVCCIVNLKAGDVKGVMSAGRCLVATSIDGKNTKAFCLPPAAAKVGEKIQFADAQGRPSDAPLSSKHFNNFLKKMHTDAKGVCQVDTVNFETSAGHCTSTIKSGLVA